MVSDAFGTITYLDRNNRSNAHAQRAISPGVHFPHHDTDPEVVERSISRFIKPNDADFIIDGYFAL